MAGNFKKGGLAAAALIAAATPFIAKHEGVRLKPYRDAGGVWTVCYGETNVPMRIYTLAECKAMFGKALEKEYGARVEDCVTKDMPIRVEVAFISLAYNTGWQGFCRSRIVLLWNAGRFHESCMAIEGYKVSQRGVGVLPGLITRRVDEKGECFAGLKEAG